MLTAALSFVVQIHRAEAGPKSELCGQAEHILSGKSTRFSSLAELEAFLRRFEELEPPTGGNESRGKIASKGGAER